MYEVVPCYSVIVCSTRLGQLTEVEEEIRAKITDTKVEVYVMTGPVTSAPGKLKWFVLICMKYSVQCNVKILLYFLQHYASHIILITKLYK